MDEKIMKFLRKNNIHISNIKYLLRQENKTCIYMTDGRVVKTFITVKDLYEILIENCTYHMRDGVRLEGRKRGAATHKFLNKSLHQDPAKTLSPNIRTRFSVLDDMPIAFCVIELIFNKNGTGIDFVFRYCNKEMLLLEGMDTLEILDQSFYQAFPNGDKKLLAAYTDVALNGGSCRLKTYSARIHRELIIKCFQPLENFCACILIPAYEIEK